MSSRSTSGSRAVGGAPRTADDGRDRVGEHRSSTPDPRRSADEVQDRQREEFGGLKWGSAIFGWLVAVGITVLLTALLSAAGAAIGFTEVSGSEARSNADTIGIAGGVALLVVFLLAYYLGGYVAGRMARFDGPRQGLGVWIVGLAVTVLLAVAGVVLGSEYNVLSQLQLPRIPIDEGSLTTGALIALAAILVGTLLAAMAGGKAGTHFHRKVDRVGRS